MQEVSRKMQGWNERILRNLGIKRVMNIVVSDKQVTRGEYLEKASNRSSASQARGVEL